MFKESETNVKHCKHIGDAESATTEWKQSLSEINEIIETAAAFANAEGGRKRVKDWMRVVRQVVR